MADSVSKTNIPVLRTPYGAEVPPKVPVCETDDVGSNINPVYVANKTIKASDASLGNTTKPIYMKNGIMTECSELAPRLAPDLQRKSGGGKTVDDVPTSTTPNDDDPATMIATKEYVDEVGARATKVVVDPKTTAGSVICAITVDGTEHLIYNGGGGSGGTITTICVPLLTPMWFDHLLVGDTTWLESQCTADQTTSNMHTKSDFPKIYEHLSTEYAAVSSTKTDTYTLNTGTTVSIVYKEAADGHKICATDQLTKLNQIFNDATIGSSWYFVLDTTNLKFQLPRTKYGFNGKLSYVKRPQVKIDDSNNRIGEETMRLFFYTGVGPTSADKMDLVKEGIGTFTTTATYGNVATFQANNGQVEDSGHKIVNAASPSGTDLVTVDYLNDKLPSSSISFNDIYPLGSIYISTTSTLPAIFTADGRQWSRVGEGRCLWGVNANNDNLDANIAAGLPDVTASSEFTKPTATTNINSASVSFNGTTGSAGAHTHSYTKVLLGSTSTTYGGEGTGKVSSTSSTTDSNGSHTHTFSGTATLSASATTTLTGGSVKTSTTRDTTIYGKSSTVQPPALGVIFWKRVA